MSIHTPKFKSGEFKAALGRLKEVLDAQSLHVILLDALDRKSAEEIVRRNAVPGLVSRVPDTPKGMLCAQITGWFFASEQVAYQTMRELDRGCEKERHLVSTIPAGEAKVRIGSYRAIALKRERAKLVWALARDERDAVRELASGIINEFFQEVADLQHASALREGEGGAASLGRADLGAELASRIQAQAERISDATTEVTALQNRLDAYEKERARLLAEIGLKERLLRQATEASGDKEVELRALRRELVALETRAEAAERKAQGDEDAKAAADRLAAKVRRLEKLTDSASRIEDRDAEVEHTRRTNTELLRQMAKVEETHARDLAQRERQESKLSADLAEAQEALRLARQRIHELEHQEPAVDPASSVAEGVVVLLDQANLAASAATMFKRKVDFTRVLERVCDGRTKKKAVAFVVDNGGDGFDAFCNTLRRAGWDLRIKTPKRFRDGTQKADWDMGIAMEAVELVGDCASVILVSGDGDFAPLVRFLKRRGVSVEVAGFARDLAIELKNAADRAIFLDADICE